MLFYQVMMTVFSYDMHTFFVFDHEIAFLVENIGIIDSFFFTQAKIHGVAEKFRRCFETL
jgi:hypothetical protein